MLETWVGRGCSGCSQRESERGSGLRVGRAQWRRVRERRAMSEVHGLGKGVTMRMRRVPGTVGLDPCLQVDLCSEAP